MTLLFLCGDVMTGRGIDQVLPHPSDPRLHEPYVRDARTYVELAERANGAIPRPASFAYIWGAALADLARVAPDARIVNLETSVTRSGAYWPGKGIHYRMHPANVGCLTAAGIDCCVLANNHVLDWGFDGLVETLDVLRGAGIRTAGAGRNLGEAQAPASIELGAGRVLVFACGAATSGIPSAWAATESAPGVRLLSDLSRAAARRLSRYIEPLKAAGDVVVVSVHWGGNWGYAIPEDERIFAHELIDGGCVDVVHGHSAHHAKGIEVYRGKLILYGCGDFLTDYEGITGHERYRGDLSLMYFVTLDASSGRLQRCEITPLKMLRFSLQRAADADAAWLAAMLTREGEALGTSASLSADGRLMLRFRVRA
ncbi:MAG TPA: CapA family protein [Gammaproteobacteria bacterium]